MKLANQFSGVAAGARAAIRSDLKQEVQKRYDDTFIPVIDKESKAGKNSATIKYGSSDEWLIFMLMERLREDGFNITSSSSVDVSISW